MNRRGYTRWQVRLRHRTQTRLYLTQGRDMAASSTATDGTTAAYDTAAYGTPQNAQRTHRLLRMPQQGVPFGRQQVQRRKATRHKGPVFSEVASSSNVPRYPQGGAAISAGRGSNGTWICTTGSVGSTALVDTTGSVVHTIPCVGTTDCVTSTASIGSGGGGFWGVHAERRRRPSAHKRKLREFRIRTACAKGAENEDV